MKTVKYVLTLTLIVSFLLAGAWVNRARAERKEKHQGGDLFTIPQIHYHGGGDWYEDQTSMIRLQERAADAFGAPAANVRETLELTDEELFDYPILFMTGHGNVDFTPEEALLLRTYLNNGGFLWASDDFGMDPSLRRELKEVYPDKQLVELPLNHEIYHNLYDFPGGLPKIHEHAGGPPHGYGIIDDSGRLTVFYDFNTDIGDGLEAPEIHNDPEEVRENAFKMALNIVMYAMTH